MGRSFIALAALSGLFSVGLGAFGAHALKNQLDEYALGVFQTAVQYQFYHTLALLAVGLLAIWHPQSGLLRASGLAFIIGIVIFSGSLYILSLTGTRWLGAVTPLGGVCFMAGWICLMWGSWRALA